MHNGVAPALEAIVVTTWEPLCDCTRTRQMKAAVCSAPFCWMSCLLYRSMCCIVLVGYFCGYRNNQEAAL